MFDYLMSLYRQKGFFFKKRRYKGGGVLCKEWVDDDTRILSYAASEGAIRWENEYLLQFSMPKFGPTEHKSHAL